MSDSIKNSHRAVAASALALVLAGGSLATTAVAGEGDKGGSRGQSGSAGSGGSGSQGQSSARRQDGQQTQAQRPTATPSSTRRPTSPPPDQAQGGRPTPHPGQGSSNPGNGSGGSGGNSGNNNGNTGQGGDGGQGADQDPAGNNGTFKVDGLPFDTNTSNEPQIECGPFRLVFFGFDEGQTGDITIAGQAPSGDAVVSKRTGVLISDDAAGGGPNDLDAIVTYELSDLDLSQLTQHPQQGYHLKVTLETDTPGGVKHKVFWIQPPCALPTTTQTPSPTPAVITTTPAVIVPTTPPASVGGVRIDRPGTPNTPTKVLGVKMTRKDTATVLGRALARGPLAFTGSFTETLLMLAGALLAAGGGFLLWARRPQGKHVA
ncbi:MAG TPA: hypothetical protein VNA20_16405 [Frankiaceae bacterium]|nr:hypothetical protein [Frankiaceae bacterium]